MRCSQTKLAELGHANCQIKFIKAEAPAGWTARPIATAPAPADPKLSADNSRRAKPRSRARRAGERENRARCRSTRMISRTIR